MQIIDPVTDAVWDGDLVRRIRDLKINQLWGRDSNLHYPGQADYPMEAISDIHIGITIATQTTVGEYASAKKVDIPIAVHDATILMARQFFGFNATMAFPKAIGWRGRTG